MQVEVRPSTKADAHTHTTHAICICTHTCMGCRWRCGRARMPSGLRSGGCSSRKSSSPGKARTRGTRRCIYTPAYTYRHIYTVARGCSLRHVQLQPATAQSATRTVAVSAGHWTWTQPLLHLVAACIAHRVGAACIAHRVGAACIANAHGCSLHCPRSRLPPALPTVAAAACIAHAHGCRLHCPRSRSRLQVGYASGGRYAWRVDGVFSEEPDEAEAPNDDWCCSPPGPRPWP